MAKPGEAHARLQKLVGRWAGDETLFPAPWDPAGGPATSVVENRLVLNGLAVVQEYQQTRHGVNNFAGHAVFWWDPASSQHVMTWFDAMSGTATEYRGGFDGDVLRLSHALSQGGYSRCWFDCGDTRSVHLPAGNVAGWQQLGPVDGRHLRPGPRGGATSAGGAAGPASPGPRQGGHGCGRGEAVGGQVGLAAPAGDEPVAAAPDGDAQRRQAGRRPGRSTALAARGGWVGKEER